MGQFAISANQTNIALLAFTRYLQLAPNSPDAKTIKDWVRKNTATASASPKASPKPTASPHRLCQTHDLPIAMTELPPGITFTSQRGHLRDDIGLVVLTGEVDISTAPLFKDDLVALVDEGVTHIVVDLTGVTFIDSTALGVLIGGVRRLHPGGGGSSWSPPGVRCCGRSRSPVWTRCSRSAPRGNKP